MNHLLPIEKNPPVKMLPGFSQPLSIIYARFKEPDIFLINNFTQLFVDNYVGVDTLEFSQVSTRFVVSFYLHNNPFSDVFNIKSINLENVSYIKALDIIKNEINNGSYVFSTLNEFFIPGTYFYKKVNMFHPELIYGYDDDLGLLYGFVYDDNPKYATITIKYEDFEKAYNKTEDELKFFTTYSLRDNIEINQQMVDFFKEDTCFTSIQHLAYSDSKYAQSYYFDGKIPQSEIMKRWLRINSIAKERSLYSGTKNQSDDKQFLDDITQLVLLRQDYQICKNSYSDLKH